MKIKHITAIILTVCLLATTTITPAYAGDWTGDNSGTDTGGVGGGTFNDYQSGYRVTLLDGNKLFYPCR